MLFLDPAMACQVQRNLCDATCADSRKLAWHSKKIAKMFPVLREGSCKMFSHKAYLRHGMMLPVC